MTNKNPNVNKVAMKIGLTHTHTEARALKHSNTHMHRIHGNGDSTERKEQKSLCESIGADPYLHQHNNSHNIAVWKGETHVFIPSIRYPLFGCGKTACDMFPCVAPGGGGGVGGGVGYAVVALFLGDNASPRCACMCMHAEHTSDYVCHLAFAYVSCFECQISYWCNFEAHLNFHF